MTIDDRPSASPPARLLIIISLSLDLDRFQRLFLSGKSRAPAICLIVVVTCFFALLGTMTRGVRSFMGIVRCHWRPLNFGMLSRKKKRDGAFPFWLKRAAIRVLHFFGDVDRDLSGLAVSNNAVVCWRPTCKNCVRSSYFSPVASNVMQKFNKYNIEFCLFFFVLARWGNTYTFYSQNCGAQRRLHLIKTVGSIRN